MSHRPGSRYGIVDLESLRVRCVIDEDTSCWNWPGAFSSGTPRMWALDVVRDVMRAMSGSTVALMHSGRRLRKGQRAFRTCHNASCCNPAHTVARTPAEHGAIVAAAGVLRGLPGRSATNTVAARTVAKLSIELAREIRASVEPNTHWARRLGVAHNTIANVRRNRTWLETAPNASVFNQRA